MTPSFEVYLHRCKVNGKGYVGVTCRGVRARLYSHESEARHGSTRPFARAIRKYGIEAFETTVLASGLTEDEAKRAEQEWIARLGTFGPGGYNATLGGDGTQGTHLSDARREAISLQFRDMPRTEKHRARISRALKGRAKPAHVIEAARVSKLGMVQPPHIAAKSRDALAKAKAVWTGQTHSDESKASMRAAKSVPLRIVRADGSAETIVSTIRAIAEASGISATAICAAMKNDRPIAKRGPLFGCRISKIEGIRNGRSS